MLIDYINGAFELCSGLFVLNNCRIVYKQKDVAGVSIISTSFFCLWGMWNMYYYPQLDQWASFVGGVGITLSNALWVYLLYKYRRKS